MKKYYKDGNEFTAEEVKALNGMTSYKDPEQLGYELINHSQEPVAGELEKFVEDGSAIVDGKRIRLWKIVGRFKDYTNSDAVVVTKLEQESEYLTKKFKASVPQVISMRQARLALLQAGLLATIETAIASGTDEAMKIEWEYATEVRRDWASLISATAALGMTDIDLDNLFILAGGL